MNKGTQLIVISCLAILLNGCAMMYFVTHMPKQEIVLSGETKLERGTLIAVVKKWTFKVDEKHNMEGSSRLTIDINNQTRGALFFRGYVITKTDGKEIKVNFLDLKPAGTSTVEERLFEAKSFSSFDIETEPLLSLIQTNQIDNFTLVFKESKIILRPK